MMETCSKTLETDQMIFAEFKVPGYLLKLPCLKEFYFLWFFKIFFINVIILILLILAE